MSDGGLVLGVDASTTACKVIAVDRAGACVGEARASYPLRSPEPDGWEQDAADWWSALCAALRTATRELGARARRIEAIALACQRETFVLVDAQGAARHPAIVWMDTRCGDQVATVTGALGAATLLEITGKVPCTTPSLYKIRWLFDRRPELRGAATRVADVHAYLASHLTGAFVSSACAADPLGLLDVRTATWGEALLDAAHLTSRQMPRLAAPGSIAGVVLDDVADALGLPRGLPLIAGAGDGQAAGLGAGALEPASVYLNVGTAIVAGRASATPVVGRAFRTLVGPVEGTWFLETDLLGGTFSFDWLARTLGDADDPNRWLAEREAEAARLRPGAEGLIFLPYLAGVMNPHWRADVGGALLGLRGDHGPAHLYRAILEGLAFETRHQLEGLEAGAEGAALIAVGGSMRRPLVRQVFADVLGRTLGRSAVAESTAMGAAAIAAAGAGWFADAREAAHAFARPDEPCAPGPSAPHYDDLYRGVARGLFEALAPSLTALASVRARR